MSADVPTKFLIWYISHLFSPFSKWQDNFLKNGHNKIKSINDKNTKCSPLYTPIEVTESDIHTHRVLSCSHRCKEICGFKLVGKLKAPGWMIDV